MKARWLLGMLGMMGACGWAWAQGAPAPAPVPAPAPAAAPAAAALSPLGAVNGQLIAWLVLASLGAIAALVFAVVFFKSMKSADGGTDRMKEIAKHVRDGAFAYLKQQYKVVGIVFVVLFILFSILSYGMELLPGLVPFAFLSGGFFSGLCGFLGMNTATLASNRTAQGARENLNRGLQIAFRSGAVMGLVVVGFALLDVLLWFLGIRLFVHAYNLEKTTVTMLSFGIGASTQALFARVGGGIYTKAADVGADLVGKVEAGIPEDDPRNPATIADNVGDNVGDVAGMGADLYESYAGSMLATMALGVAAIASVAADKTGTMAKHFGVDVSSAAAIQQAKLSFLFAPMALAGLGTLFSILGVFLVRSGDQADQSVLLKALYRGINVASLGTAIVAYPVVALFCGDAALGVWIAILAGLAAGYGIGKATEYYTSHEYGPTRGIAKAGEFGPATVIIEGTAVGMMSTVLPVLFVAIGILVAFAAAGGFTAPAMGLYGVGIAAVGMLSTLGITLATDAYGPIADNAGGNAEMAGLEPEVRQRTDALDALGNTTAAVGKGFAIGSAALTALALLAAYIEEVRSGLGFVARGLAHNAEYYGVKIAQVGGEWIAEFPDRVVNGHVIPGSGSPVHEAPLAMFMDFYAVNLMNPRVLVGMFLGAMMAYLFCALTMKAVGRAAGSMVEEVRRQFKEIPGIMEGEGTPDYALCVDISTKGAQREMLTPSLIAIAAPVFVGLTLGVAGVLGLLTGTLSAGFVLAVMMAGAGGAWDNAKKYVEEGNFGGKGSDTHKATVVGDTVGDPFKDTSGPSLNILIKLMTMVSVVFAAVVVKYGPAIGELLHMGPGQGYGK